VKKKPLGSAFVANGHCLNCQASLAIVQIVHDGGEVGEISTPSVIYLPFHP